MIRDYRDLEVWKRAVDFSVEIYRCTRSWPAEERYGLVSQVRRAAVSVASNIAEGQGRGEDRDFARFLRIALGSLREVDTQIQIAFRLGYLDRPTLSEIHERTEEIARMIHGLLRRLIPGERPADTH